MKHSTIDHGITLRHIIEKVCEGKEELFCLFVDFKNAFDMVPRETLSSRMEEIEIPLHYGVFFHRLYEVLKAKIRTSTHISKRFRSGIEVKQG